jgi:hypothetical protein
VNLGEALNEAIGLLGRDPEPKSPITSDRGLHARMNALEKEHGDPRAAARAIGVSPETWGRWRKTGTNPRTGKPHQRPGRAAVARLKSALLPIYRRTYERSVQAKLRAISNVRVSARINWDGYYNAQNDGYRGTNLNELKRGSMARLYAPWVAGDLGHLAGLFEVAVSQAYDDSIVNFEGDQVVVEWS